MTLTDVAKIVSTEVLRQESIYVQTNMQAIEKNSSQFYLINFSTDFQSIACEIISMIYTNGFKNSLRNIFLSEILFIHFEIYGNKNDKTVISKVLKPKVRSHSVLAHI